MRVPHLSPIAYRRITIVAAILLAIIIVTGGAVRLSDSGLGCPSWPNCSSGQLTAHAQSDSHQWIESLNRMFTGLVSVAVIVAVLGSLVRIPKRRDLVWLSLGLVAGVFAQAVLGGLTVLFDLKPGFVMAHFLLSIVLLTNAIVLVRRAGQPDAPAHAVVTRAPSCSDGCCSGSPRSCSSPGPSSPVRDHTAAAASGTTCRASTCASPTSRACTAPWS